MPNARNVSAPINIHGFGRSGTTLLQNILGATGYIQVCNETNGFVFCCYRGGEVLSTSYDKHAPGGNAIIATRTLHAALCAAMPSNKPSWCQKLGGIPNYVVFETMLTDSDRHYAREPYAFPYAWFWRVLAKAFPCSHDILILRDYRDIVVSRARLSGYRPIDVARDLAVYFNTLSHPDSHIGHVIMLADLVANPQATISQVFSRMELTFDPGCLKAMQWYAAASQDRCLTAARAANFSWRAEYDAVLGDSIDDVMAQAVGRLAARFQIDPARLGLARGPILLAARHAKAANSKISRMPPVTALAG